MVCKAKSTSFTGSLCTAKEAEKRDPGNGVEAT